MSLHGLYIYPPKNPTNTLVMDDFLERTYFDNSVRDYLIALVIFLVSVLVIRLLKGVIIKMLQKWSERTESTLDDLIVQTVSRFGIPALNFIALYFAIFSLDLSPKLDRVLEVAMASVVAFFLIRLVASVVRYFLEDYVRKQEHGEEKVTQVQGIVLIITIVIWALGLLLLFSNLGYDVTAIVAGLGIGGIAVALAAQNIISDLFNYLVIFFDKPFEVGDFIIVDEKLGTVNHIGIKTTRIKSLSGEQLVFSNSDLTNSRIHNYKRMQTRRIVFTIGITYQTDIEKVREIPDIVRDIIKNQERTTFDRAHLRSFDESCITYEAVHIVQSADYNVYMDIQQEINLRILEAFQERGIQFAYPTRTVHLSPQPEDEQN